MERLQATLLVAQAEEQLRKATGERQQVEAARAPLKKKLSAAEALQQQLSLHVSTLTERTEKMRQDLASQQRGQVPLLPSASVLIDPTTRQRLIKRGRRSGDGSICVSKEATQNMDCTICLSGVNHTAVMLSRCGHVYCG